METLPSVVIHVTERKYTILKHAFIHLYMYKSRHSFPYPRLCPLCQVLSSAVISIMKYSFVNGSYTLSVANGISRPTHEDRSTRSWKGLRNDRKTRLSWTTSSVVVTDAELHWSDKSISFRFIVPMNGVTVGRSPGHIASNWTTTDGPARQTFIFMTNTKTFLYLSSLQREDIKEIVEKMGKIRVEKEPEFGINPPINIVLQRWESPSLRMLINSSDLKPSCSTMNMQKGWNCYLSSGSYLLRWKIWFNLVHKSYFISEFTQSTTPSSEPNNSTDI